MIKKTFFFLIIGSIFCQNNLLQAQDPQFSQYYAAPLYLNPALVGINQKGRIGFNYRNQWPNLDANFETFATYFDYHFEDYHSSIGLIFTNDREGIAGLNSSTIGFQYAYQLQLTPQWAFRPGVELAYTYQDINFDKLVFGDQLSNTGLNGNPTMEANTGLATRFFDLSLGGVFYNPSLWLGVAVHHILEPNQSIAGGNAPLDRKISVHGGYRIFFNPATQKATSKERSFTPSFNYQTQGDFDQLDLGVYFTISPLLVGVWYRGVPIKNLGGVANNEAVIFMLGLQTNRVTFGYSFDYTLSQLRIGTGGAHEISIAYSFNLGSKLKPAAHIRRLQCPIPFIF